MANEEDSVEQAVLGTVCGGVTWNRVSEKLASYGSESKGWRFGPDEERPRPHSGVLVESIVRDALIRLNPEIKAQHHHVGEGLFQLPTMLLSEQCKYLVGADAIGVCPS